MWKPNSGKISPLNYCGKIISGEFVLGKYVWRINLWKLNSGEFVLEN